LPRPERCREKREAYSASDLRKVQERSDEGPQFFWVSIINIQYQNSGIHTMYDIYTTTPGNYIANDYLDPLKDGPH